MTYELAIGDRLFSSWSLRGWLLFNKFDVPAKVRHYRMYSPQFDQFKIDFAPARTVPAVKTDTGIIWDSLAIAETLADQHPDKGYWPKDPTARAFARTISAEMHSSFVHLRSNCPMDIRHSYGGYDIPDDVMADVQRIEFLWETARGHATQGPWLFGAYSIADVLFAPVAMRFACYGLAQSGFAKTYVGTHLNDPVFRRWRAMGFAENFQQTVYDKDMPKTSWPGPKPLKAVAAIGTDSENEKCPYSGDAVTHLLELDGRRWGFCNAFCRDKTLHDPEAWPAFMDMINQA